MILTARRLRSARRPGVAVVAALLGWCAIAAAAPPPYRVPDARVQKLDNGLTVAVFRDPRLPLVHAQVTVPAGSAAEGPKQIGAAYVTTQLMGRMTSSRGIETVQADLEKVGGSLSSQVGRDFAWLSATFLSRELSGGFELLSDAVMQAVFPEVEVEHVRRTAQAALVRPANTALQADDALWSAVFADGPYGHAMFGNPEAFETLTYSQVRAFHASYWAPDHAWLVIAGDVDPDSAMAAAVQWFGPWNKSGAAAPASKPAAAKRALRIIDRPDVARSEVVVGMLGPPAGDRDEIAMALAAPLAGRPGSDLRNVRSGQSSLRDGGIVWIAATTPHDSVAIVARRLEARLLALREAGALGGAIDSLARAVRLTYPMRFETLGGLVSQWSANAALGLPPQALAEFPQRLNEITPQGFSQSVARWITRDRIVIAVVGPATTIRPRLEKLAPLQVVATAAPPGSAPAPTTAPVSAASAKRGRELVRRLVTAHGGLPVLRKIRDSTLEANVMLSVEGRTMSGTIRQIRVEPDRMVSTNDFEGLGIRQVLDGTTAWSSPTDSIHVTQEADSQEVASLRQTFRSDVPHLLLDASDPQARVAARGSDRIDGVAVEKVEVWPTTGVRRLLFIDAKTGLLAATEEVDVMGGNPNVIVQRRFQDTRPVEGGLKLPHTEERWLSGIRAMELKVTRLEINTGIPDATFARPEEQLPPVSR